MGKMEGSIFVSGLKTGDAEAWRHLFVRYYAVYLRFITKIVGDMTSAEDIAQEVFLKLWKSRERLDSEASVEKLLYSAEQRIHFSSGPEVICSGGRVQSRRRDFAFRGGGTASERA